MARANRANGHLRTFCLDIDASASRCVCCIVPAHDPGGHGPTIFATTPREHAGGACEKESQCAHKQGQLSWCNSSAWRAWDGVFTLSGNQILPIYDAGLDAGLTFTDTRHEAAAAHMADAWARTRGEPGVCLFSAGPGHTNALSAILNAARAESPVLWLSGGTTRAGSGRGGFQDLDQIGLAWRTMLSGRPGPVHLTLPADLLAQPANVTLPAALDLAPTIAAADPVAVVEALALLATALKPLVLAGPGLARGRGAAAVALEDFVEATGLPCLPVESPRGLTDPIYQGMGRKTSEADIVLLLASRDYAVSFAQPPAFAACRRVIVVDADPMPGPADLALVGDPATVLGQLAAGAGRHEWNVDPWLAELGATRSAANAELVDVAESAEVPIHPLRLATEIHDLLPTEATTIFDGGEFAQWARWAFGDWRGQTLVNGKLGMIGPRHTLRHRHSHRARCRCPARGRLPGRWHGRLPPDGVRYRRAP